MHPSKATSSVVHLLAEASVDWDSTDRGKTALVCACDNGHAEIVRVLLEARASVDLHNCHGETALIFACYNGHAEIARMLLEAGANKDWQSRLGCTALMCARERGHIESVQP